MAAAAVVDDEGALAEVGLASEIAAQLQAGGEADLEATALELLQRGAEEGGAAAAGTADVTARLLQELPTEQARVLRRLLLQAAQAQFDGGAADGWLGICALLAELYAQEAIPETVVHDCLEQLLWDTRHPRPTDIDCVCALLGSVGPLLEESELDAADEIMDDFFDRLQHLAASEALPHQQHQAVRALLRRRAAGWEEGDAPEGEALVALAGRGGGGPADDWRAVLDRKKEGGGGGGGGEGVQDSARREGRGAAAEGAATAGAAAAAAAGAGGAAAAGEPAPPNLEQQKQAAVADAVAAAGGAGEWTVAQLSQQLLGSALDLSTAEDAGRLLPPLLDAAVDAAASVLGGGSLVAGQDLPASIAGCCALVAHLAGRCPPVGAAAATHLSRAFRQRAAARSAAARQRLGLQMLLAGALREALPEAQLHSMLEQLARQVMNPTPSDVVCLLGLLRGAAQQAESRKGGWWKAAAQLAASPNVAPDLHRELQHLLLLREAQWDAAAAAAAAAELEARRQAEVEAAALAEARLQRQAQEEAAARATAEVAAAEEKIKAAAARLAELQRQQAVAEAAASQACIRAQQAEAVAAGAAARQAESDRMAAVARRQAQEAQAAEAQARQAAADAAAAPAGGGGKGRSTELGRHWYYAYLGGYGPYGPVTASELLAWQYKEPTLAGELQVIEIGEVNWLPLEQRLADLQDDLPPLPHRAGAVAAIPTMPAPGAAAARGAAGRGGRGAGRGRGGSTEFPSELMPPPDQAAGRGGRGRGRGREAAPARGRGGRGRGDVPPRSASASPSAKYATRPVAAAPQPQPQQQQAPPRPASPPAYDMEELVPHLYALEEQPAVAQPAVAPAAPAPTFTGGGYNPMRAAAAPPRQTDLCPGCFTNESTHLWVPCGHRGHCSDCLPDYFTNEEKLQNCPSCLVCRQPASAYMRVYD